MSTERDQPPLDTTLQIVTPENIAFDYRVAGPFLRLPAYLIDFSLRLFLVLLASLAALTLAILPSGLGEVGLGLVLVLYFVLDWFYGGLFEALWNGQTPGKRLLRLRVIAVEGQPLSGWQAILRNLLRAADILPFGYALGAAVAGCNRRFQRLGDLAAGTMVIVESPPERHGVVRLIEPDAVRLAAQLPAKLKAPRSLARALSAYVQRRPALHARRRLEVALHLAEPLKATLGLPANTNPDLLLCALYYRTFIADQAAAADQARSAPPASQPPVLASVSRGR